MTLCSKVDAFTWVCDITDYGIKVRLFFAHLDQNSGPEKPQLFGKILTFLPETQVKFPQNSGIRKHF